MSLDDGLSKFLGGLYEAVYDRDRWRSAMAEIVNRSGSRLSIVTSVDLRHQEFGGVQLHGSEESSVETGLREYTEEMSSFDPALKWARDHPAAGMCETSAIVPRQDERGDPFFK
jgi:hypothetical protein